MPLSKDHEQLALARFLPRCLFVLFNQVSAYGKACDKNLSAIIIGNLDEAKEFKANGGHESEDEDDDEAGDDGNEEDEPGKKRLYKCRRSLKHALSDLFQAKRSEEIITKAAVLLRQPNLARMNELAN